MQLERQKLVIDLSRKMYNTVWAVKGDDNVRSVDVYFIQNDAPFDLTDVNVQLYAELPTKNKIYANITKINNQLGRAEFIIPPQISAQGGTTKCCMVLRSSNKQAVTFDFGILVDQGCFDSKAIEASDDFSALRTALNEVDNLEINYSPRLTTMELKQVEIDEAMQDLQGMSKSKKYHSEHFSVPHMLNEWYDLITIPGGYDGVHNFEMIFSAPPLYQRITATIDLNALDRVASMCPMTDVHTDLGLNSGRLATRLRFGTDADGNVKIQLRMGSLGRPISIIFNASSTLRYSVFNFTRNSSTITPPTLVNPLAFSDVDLSVGGIVTSEKTYYNTQRYIDNIVIHDDLIMYPETPTKHSALSLFDSTCSIEDRGTHAVSMGYYLYNLKAKARMLLNKVTGALTFQAGKGSKEDETDGKGDMIFQGFLGGPLNSYKIYTDKFGYAMINDRSIQTAHSCTPQSRPEAPMQGLFAYDRTLRKIIVWDGNNWCDANGTVV